MNQLTMTVRIVRLVYVVFFASVLMYFGIGQYLGAGAKPVADLTRIRNIFWLAGAGSAIVAVAFRFRLMPALPEMPPSEQELAPLLQRFRTCYLASFALAESVAIFGLVLRLLGGSFHETLPFFAVAVLLFGLFFPRLPDSYLG